MFSTLTSDGTHEEIELSLINKAVAIGIIGTALVWFILR